ncbi:MAG: anthranilate synthase component I, partial [Beijerinckiaceae bacterium]|nr:anthranilate synthase component I [Beijerinckiaceae bacterium]
MSQTQYADFARAFEAGKPSLVATTLVADLETPVSAFLKLTAARSANVFLLESVEGGAARGRYSMIGLDPDIVWRATGDGCEINRNALTDASAFTPMGMKPLAGLRALIA